MARCMGEKVLSFKAKVAFDFKFDPDTDPDPDSDPERGSF